MFQSGSQQETDGALEIIQGDFNYTVPLHKDVGGLRGATKDGSVTQIY